MTTPLDEIISRYNARRGALGQTQQRQREILEIYEGRADVVLPEFETEAPKEPSTANLILQTIDQLGTRIASRTPDLTFWPKNKRDKQVERAATKRRVTLGWWENWETEVKDGRLARRLVAYGSAPTIIRPDAKTGLPKRHLLEPLNTFPGSMPDPDDMDPPDVIYDYRRSYGWISTNYPEQAGRLRRNSKCDLDTMFTIVEFNDDLETVVAVIGEEMTTSSAINADLPPYQAKGRNINPAGGTFIGTEWVVQLERVPNLAGICRAVTPGRVTLGRSQGHVDSLIAPYRMSAYLFALEIEAVKRGIFPNEWVVLEENGDIVTAADGVAGIVGEIKSGRVVVNNLNPGYKTDTTLAMLERSMRQSGRVAAEFGGESPSLARTGRRGEQILSNLVDYDIAEAHRITARAKKHEVMRAIAVAKGYFGDKPKSFYVSWPRATGMVDYVPNELFDDANCTVRYSHAGADVNNLNVGIGSLKGLGLMSDRTAMESHPWIDDPDTEHDRIVAERLDTAIAEQLLVPGAVSVPDLARARQIVAEGKADLHEAILQAQREAQERQATSGEPGAPDGPVDPNSPEAQPGLAPPGAGVEAGVAPDVAPPDLNMRNVAQVFGAVRRPVMTVANERTA